MPDLPFIRRRLHVALLLGLAAAHANAQTSIADRAALEPVGGVQVIYEREGSEDTANAPGRFEGSLETPAGTLRSTIHAVPAGVEPFQLGETSFEWADRVFGGRVELRALQDGGGAASWRTRMGAHLTAALEGEWTPGGTGQTLRLNRSFGDSGSAEALLAGSQTAAGQGARVEFDFSQDSGAVRWNVGLGATGEDYAAATAAPPTGAVVRLGAQWRLLRHTLFEARMTHQFHDGADAPASSLMLGTQFDLPGRLSLMTRLDTDAHDHKLSLTLVVPLAIR